MIDAATKTMIRERAGQRCEYCHLPQESLPAMAFHVEHVIPKQHHGGDQPENLALACDRCNFYKGPNLSAIDPESGDIVPLFNPRKDRWMEHFRLEAFRIVGATPTGRATTRLFHMNAAARVELRREVGQHS